MGPAPLIRIIVIRLSCSACFLLGVLRIPTWGASLHTQGLQSSQRFCILTASRGAELQWSSSKFDIPTPPKDRQASCRVVFFYAGAPAPTRVVAPRRDCHCQQCRRSV